MKICLQVEGSHVHFWQVISQYPSGLPEIVPLSFIQSSPHLPHSACLSQPCSLGGGLSTQSACTKTSPALSVKNTTSIPVLSVLLRIVGLSMYCFSGAKVLPTLKVSASKAMSALMTAACLMMWNRTMSSIFFESSGSSNTWRRFVISLPWLRPHSLSIFSIARLVGTSTVNGPSSFLRGSSAPTHGGAGGQYHKKQVLGLTHLGSLPPSRAMSKS
mmetsp:Transcript_6942/g.17747  ORF Transcript_6942/g.17747 Transcript_6942/m.17747 type:complete len:216 (+) Transcript_6942:935-1582(+)